MSRLVLNRFSILKEVQLFTSRCYYSKLPDQFLEENVNAKPKRSKVPITKILLINHNKDILGAVTMEEANALAKRRNLQLRKVESDATAKQHKLESYQLFTMTQVRGGKSESKEEKDVTISGKIAEHDLNVKLKSIAKWMDKGFVVNIVMNNVESTEQGDKMIGGFEKSAVEKTYKVVNKHYSSEKKVLKFVLQLDKKKIAAQKAQDEKISAKLNDEKTET